jgi:hypothetical protein
VVVVAGGRVVVVVAAGDGVGLVVGVALAPEPSELDARDAGSPAPEPALGARGWLGVETGGAAAVDVVVSAGGRARAPVPGVRVASIAAVCPDPGVPRAWDGPPAVATSRAMSANDTAKITHQLGRPRTTRERRLPVVSAP